MVIKQPNGLFAIFSGVVDNFIQYHGTEKEILEVLRKDMGERLAEEAMRAGKEDWPHMKYMSPGSGHDRWDHALRTIERVHKEAGLKEWMALYEDNDPTKKLWAVAISVEYRSGGTHVTVKTTTMQALSVRASSKDEALAKAQSYVLKEFPSGTGYCDPKFTAQEIPDSWVWTRARGIRMERDAAKKEKVSDGA